MRFLLLGTALMLPLATTGCEHHYYTARDPYYHDRHRWDDRENGYYNQWVKSKSTATRTGTIVISPKRTKGVIGTGDTITTMIATTTVTMIMITTDIRNLGQKIGLRSAEAYRLGPGFRSLESRLEDST